MHAVHFISFVRLVRRKCHHHSWNFMCKLCSKCILLSSSAKITSFRYAKTSSLCDCLTVSKWIQFASDLRSVKLTGVLLIHSHELL